MEIYLRRTWDLPLNPWVDERRPFENVFRLFVTATAPRPTQRYSGLSADTVAGRMKKLMHKAGIDVSAVQPHILRSASIRAALSSGEQVDVVLKRAQVSQKVFSIYYDLPVGYATSGAVADAVGAEASALMLSQRSAPDSQQPVEEGPSQQLLLTDRNLDADIDR